MIDALSALAAALRAADQSVTRPRRLVFEALQGHEPMTMRELVSACPDVDRASIYRTVALFEALGIVERITIGWKYKLELSDRFQSHHHHIACTVCGKLEPLSENKQLEAIVRKLALSQGFRPESHQVEIRGICQDCQKKSIPSL